MVSRFLFNLQDFSSVEAADWHSSLDRSTQQSMTTIAFADRVLGNIGAPLRYGTSDISEESDEGDLDASDTVMLGLPAEENIEMAASPSLNLKQDEQPQAGA